MNAWLFQDTRQKAALRDKCLWSVGWYDADGRKRSKKVGTKSVAEKYRKQVEAKLSLGLCTSTQRTRWDDFRAQFRQLELATKLPSTAKIYERSLDEFERIVNPVYMDTIKTATLDSFRAKRMLEQARVPIRAKSGTATKAKAAKSRPRTISPATVNKDLRHIRAALKKALRWEMLGQAPDVGMLREPERDPYFIDDATFAKLYEACESMAHPAERRYHPKEWWQALFCFAYLTGWRIGEILDIRRDDLDLEKGTVRVDAESTKGRREARVELHPIVVDHLKAILEFQPFVFDWPHHERTLWTDFAALKVTAGVEFPGAFHRFRFGFANANVDHIDADLLQKLMRHKSGATTRVYINAAERMKRSGVAERLHVPPVLKGEQVTSLPA